MVTVNAFDIFNNLVAINQFSKFDNEANNYERTIIMKYNDCEQL